MLLLVPYPFREGVGIPEYIFMETINYATSPKEMVTYKMYVDDILLSLMFIRFYFLIIGITMFAPTNSSLYVKRAAFDKGFKPDFFFQVRANLARFQIRTILIISLLSITFFSYTIRIYERPFYSEIGSNDF